MISGYVIRVDDYDGGLLVQLDTTCKVIRSETMLDLISDCIKKNPGSYKDTISKELIGTTAITTYNNKSYRYSIVA